LRSENKESSLKMSHCAPGAPCTPTLETWASPWDCLSSSSRWQPRRVRLRGELES